MGKRWGLPGPADPIAGLLQESWGQSVLPERVSARLGLSIATVGEAVRQLKREGYAIGVAKRSGYRLRRVPDVLLPRVVRNGLRSRVIGSSLISFLRASSTNDIALTLAARGCPDGFLVVAEEQWGGRGRFRRRWISPPGKGLLFSVVLRGNFPVAGAQVLTFLAAVAAAKAIRALHGIPVELKWPNDLIVRGRKLGGILTEIVTKAGRLRYAVIGVGINVNMTGGDLPKAVRDSATSVRIIRGGQIVRVPLLRRILEEMDRRYLKLVAHGGRATEWLLDEWRSLTPMMGKLVRVKHLSEERDGIVVGVDGDGALLLRSPEGLVTRVLAGDVIVLR